MTFYYLATEAEAQIQSTGAVAETTSGTTYDSSWSRAALSESGGNDSTSDPGVAIADYWASFLYQFGSSPGTGQPWQFADNAGTQMFRANLVGTRTVQFQYWNGSAWTNIGSTYAFASSSVNYRCDLHVVPGASGSFEFYVNGVSVLTGSASMTAFASLRKFRHGPLGSTQYISEIVIASESTVAHRVKTVPPTANGTDTDGTGAITTINEAVMSTATYLELSTAGHKRSWVNANPSLTGNIRAVSVTAYAMRVDATGPQKIKPYVLISGTRYYGTTFTLTTGFLPYQYVWELNPATGVAWTAANVNSTAFEKGWEAVT